MALRLTRELGAEFAKRLGFEPNRVCGITWTPERVYVTLFDQTEDGKMFIDQKTGEVVTVTHELQVYNEEEATE